MVFAKRSRLLLLAVSLCACGPAAALPPSNSGAAPAPTPQEPPSPCLSPRVAEHRQGTGRSCADIHAHNPSGLDGIYTIDPDGSEGPGAPFEAFCNMSLNGGGWTLFANHKDGEVEKVARPLVTPNALGVMTPEHWISSRETMTEGMLFLDENGLVSVLSRAKLQKANCVPVQNASDLTSMPGGRLWHEEQKDCEVGGKDYSLIILATRDEYPTGFGMGGASLDQMSGVKFDKWPYAGDWSYESQNCLLYFLK